VLALAPGDPFGDMVTNPNVPPEVRLTLRDKFGLDEPIWIRYVHWLSAMLKGDWGVSFVSQMGVGELILQRLPTSIGVLGAAQVLAILVGIPAGLLAAVRPYSVLDQITNTLAFIGFSLPTFLTGLLLILVFSVQLHWLPSVYRSDIPGSGWPWVWEHIRQSMMPVAVLGLFQGASLVRYVRSSALDVIRLDYITVARSKGISELRVHLLHVARNALIPVLTLIMLQIPTIFGGAIVTEQIFRIPGIGSLLITAILANDTPVVMGVTFVFSCLVVVFNLVADILYGWLDPRIALR
jgi:peptide/nickel transport system permease protein